MPRQNDDSDQEQKDLVPLTLRIPKNIHARLKEISQTEYRSLNHQVIMALSYFIDMQERFGTLPHPDAVKKAIPENGKNFTVWLSSANGVGSSGKGAR